MPLPKHCNGCFYRRSLGADSGEKFCAYILIEGHSRGCSVEVCDKKKKAGRKKKNGGRISIDEDTNKECYGRNRA